MKKKVQIASKDRLKVAFEFIRPSWRKLFSFLGLMFAIALLKIIVYILALLIPVVFSYFDIELFSRYGLICLIPIAYVFACYGVLQERRMRSIFYTYLSVLLVQIFIATMISLYILSRVGLAALMTGNANQNPVLVLDRGPCFGSCPVYTFVVFGNGSAFYNGNRNSKHDGFYTGVVNPNAVNKIMHSFLLNNYFALHDEYSFDVTDMASVTTGFYYGGINKVVWNYGSAGPAKLQRLEKELDELANNITWHQVNASKELCDAMYGRPQTIFNVDDNKQYNLPRCYSQ